MFRSLTAALAIAVGLTAGAAHAATLNYDYDLQPGRLHFAVDSTKLTPAGFGSVNPTSGLLSFSLQLSGLSFTAADQDPSLGPTYPLVTLVRFAPNFISFQPANAAGSYDFTAFSGVVTPLTFTFTDPNGNVIAAGGAILPEPATIALLSVGFLGLAAARRRA